MSRIVSWFSCGAASAVATKLAIEKSQPGAVTVARCWLAEEHPDNDRFADDCTKWFGQDIVTLRSEKYSGSVHEVITKRRLISTRDGAPCTTFLKKEVRRAFERPGDTNVFGYTVEEEARLDAFIDANPSARVWAPLIEAGLTHADCLALVERAGIRLPEMYRLGYKHNNCIGCVKGGAWYWNKIRVDFPDRFAQMAQVERELGASMLRKRVGNGKRIPLFLDQLPPDAGRADDEPAIQCGINCELVARDITD